MFAAGRTVIFIVLLTACAKAVSAYSLLGSSWPANSQIPIELRLGAAPSPLRDGSTSYDGSAAAALNSWNDQLVKVQFSPVAASDALPAEGDGRNSVFFSDTIYGEPFGSRTLAVTIVLRNAGTNTETDVIFNQRYAWDSYYDPLPDDPGAPIDLRRVALHEFGHVLGLGHPDLAGEYAPGIMYSRIGNTTQLAPDDIAGIDHLYGARFISPTAATAIVGEPFSFQVALDTPTTEVFVSPWPPGLRFDPPTRILSGTPIEERTFELEVSARVKNRRIVQPLRLTVLARRGPALTFLDFTQAVRYYNSTRHVYVTPASGLKVTRDEYNRVFIRGGSDGPVIFFRAPNGGVLQPGVYENASREYWGEADRPTLNIGGFGDQCDGGIGRFVIGQITYGLRGTITSMSATFEQDCSSGTRVHNSGEVRFFVDPADPIPLPRISAPEYVAGVQDQPLSFGVSSSGTGPIKYDALGLPFGTVIDFQRGVVSGRPRVAGRFDVRIFATDELGVGETRVTIDVQGAGTRRRSLVNISTRAHVGTGEDAVIAGFIVRGGTSFDDRKTLLLRALGPSLLERGIRPDQALFDPELLITGGFGYHAYNEDWMPQEPPDKLGPASQVQSSGLAPAHRVEPAAVGHLLPGSYTMLVRGAKDSTGVGLAEVYDIMGDTTSLANISTRARVGVGGDVLIGGFIIGGDAPTRVIIRAIGPSLQSSNVASPLADPVVDLYDVNGSSLASNDNWRTEQQAEIIATTVPPNDDRESAIVRALPPGNYTTIVSGKNGSTGVALVEIYNLEPN